MNKFVTELQARAKELDSPRYYHGEATLLQFAAEVVMKWSLYWGSGTKHAVEVGAALEVESKELLRKARIR